MTIFAIDPGTEESAVVCLDGAEVDGDIKSNERMLLWMFTASSAPDAVLVIEQVESYGMAVGREVFDTVFWAGRMAEAWMRETRRPYVMLPRRAVKLHLCNSARAKDANIRQALIDRYGGKDATKKGGPLHGIKSHLWAALALAVTYQDQQAMALHGRVQGEGD